MAHVALDAVGKLIKTHRTVIEISPTHRYTVTAPCLLAQLHDAIGVGMERGGGASVPGSRPPVDTEALDLWHDIAYTVHAWADHLGIDRRDKHPESETPHVGRLLRTVAATASSTGRERLTDKVIERAENWRTRITVYLAGIVPQRGIRGAQCEHCGHSTVLEIRDDGTYKVPAIVVVTEPDTAWIVCQACGDTRPLAVTDVDEPDELAYRTETRA